MEGKVATTICPNKFLNNQKNKCFFFIPRLKNMLKKFQVFGLITLHLFVFINECSIPLKFSLFAALQNSITMFPTSVINFLQKQ